MKANYSPKKIIFGLIFILSSSMIPMSGNLMSGLMGSEKNYSYGNRFDADYFDDTALEGTIWENNNWTYDFFEAGGSWQREVYYSQVYGWDLVFDFGEDNLQFIRPRHWPPEWTGTIFLD